MSEAPDLDTLVRQVGGDPADQNEPHHADTKAGGHQRQRERQQRAGERELLLHAAGKPVRET